MDKGNQKISQRNNPYCDKLSFIISANIIFLFISAN